MSVDMGIRHGRCEEEKEKVSAIRLFEKKCDAES